MLASRPKTLAAGILPVLLASGYTATQRPLEASLVLIPLSFALVLQVGTNFHNDRCDGLRGADGPERMGPPRAVASGWIAPRVMQRAVWVCMTLGIGLASLLLAQHLWVLPIAMACIAAALAYTGGAKPLAYRGYGELLCLVFFGWVAFLATAWLQGARLGLEAWTLSTSCGSYAAALISINNARDRAEDQRSNKKTLAVRYGDGFARWEIAAALALPVVLSLASGAWGSLLGALPSLRIWWALPALRGAAWNGALGLTAVSYLLFTIGALAQWHLLK